LSLLTKGAIKQDDLKRKAEQAERSIQRLISLVKELLDLEKLESGMMEMALAPVSVASILERAAESVAEFAEQHNVTIEAGQPSVCKALVEQHGGTIGLESEEGKGSEFCFRIPRKPAPSAAPD